MVLLARTDYTWPLIVIVVSLLIGWLWRSGRKGHPTSRGSALIFGPSLLLKLILSFGMILFLALGIGVLLVNPVEQVWWGALLSFAFAILCLFGWPYSIVVDPRGLYTRHLLQKSRQILWPNIASITVDSKSNKTTVVDNDGSEIIHRGFHVAPDQFLDALRRYSKYKIRLT